VPRYGVSILKNTLFRGVQQEFANVYHYECPGIALTADTDQENLLDQLVTLEKTWHATDVNFVRGRVWNTGSGSPGTNLMRIDKLLSGAGALAPIAGLDKERAILVRWPAGLNSRNRPVYLRKWYHTNAAPVGTVIGTTIMENEVGFTDPDIADLAAIFDNLDQLTVNTTPCDLCAQSGREITGGPEPHKYLEHHQLGDMWRG
jgi:hypothetical protein